MLAKDIPLTLVFSVIGCCHLPESVNLIFYKMQTIRLTAQNLDFKPSILEGSGLISPRIQETSAYLIRKT